MTAVRAVVAKALRDAASHNESVVPPVAVLWPDPDKAWLSAIPALREALPLLTLGDHDPECARGPALWLRAVLAASGQFEMPPAMPEPGDRSPWVIYLPGVSSADLRDAASIEDRLAPLLALSHRCTWWRQSSDKAWTPHSFLGSPKGAELDLAEDAATHDALAAALTELLSRDVEDLRVKGRLDSAKLNALLVPDPIGQLLRWIDDPEELRAGLSAADWSAFTSTMRTSFGIDPAKDTTITAAGLLGRRAGEWRAVWDRFAQAPHRHPGIATALDQARPQGALFGGDDPHPDSWPSWNTEQESLLREAIAALGASGNRDHARSEIERLAAEHGPRTTQVWAELGQAPLAAATLLLAELATAGTPTGDLRQVAAWYAGEGYRVDDLALRALASAPSASDRKAVLAALGVLYDPWVDDLARQFQKAAVPGYQADTGLKIKPGTCVVYVDALRMDLGRRLAARLGSFTTTLSHRLAAFPSVTPTGQPSVLPLPERWHGGSGFDAADSEGRSIKGTVLRGALASHGVQYLEWGDVGDPSGRAWTQTNSIDSQGHKPPPGHSLVNALGYLLDDILDRIVGLVSAGWRRVVVVTDHGFLLPAAPAAKVELPLLLTDGDASRKPRVARLKAGATKPAFPTLPWTWDADVEMVSAPGASAFQAGTLYEHGGLSPQECVTPVLIVEPATAPTGAVHIESLKWTGQRCRIDVSPSNAAVTIEIRTQPGDPGSTVAGPKEPSEGELRLLVDEATAEEGATVHVVALDGAGAVVAQRATTVGGES